MRLTVVFIFIVMLYGCGTSPKDYSAAKKLESIKTHLTVRPIWVKPTGSVPVYTHAQLQPSIEGDNIYIASVNGDVRLLNALKGDLLWKVSLNEVLTSSPGVGENLIYLGSRDAKIIALDIKTGAERWRVGVTSEILARPLVSGDSLFIQTIDGKITSLDSVTGKFNWSYSHDIPKLTLRGTASPLIKSGQIIAGFSDGKLVSINAKTGELNWSSTITVQRGRTDLERLADIDGIFQASGDSVYVSSYQGRVASVSISDGTVQWARKMSSYTGLSVDEGHIYISDTKGHVWSLDARTGATLWRQQNLAGRELSTPVVMDNVIAVADFEGYTHWLDVDDGQFVARQSMEEVWNAIREPDSDILYSEEDNEQFPRLVTASPLAANNTLYIRDNTGALAAFHIESSSRN